MFQNKKYPVAKPKEESKVNHKFKFMFLLMLLILSACGGGGGEVTAIPTHTPPPPTPTVPPTPSASEHNEQGKVYFDQRDWEQAAAAFQTAIELEPDNALFYGNLGVTLGELGQHDQAVTVLEKAIELDPDYAKAYSNLCFVYQSQNKLEAALPACETALMLDDEDAETYNNLGTIHAKQGNPDAAIAQFQKAIQLEPEHDWAHNNLGRIYSDLGRLDEAVAELREAIRITPDRAISFYNLGLTLARQELYAQAVPEYQKALELDPNFIGIHKDLGVIYLNLDQAEQAIASFETYLQLEPNDPETAAIEAQIARLEEQAAIFDDLLSETFTAQEGQLSFRHPPDWQVMPDVGDDFFVLTSDLEALDAEDLSQPFGFCIGEIGWTDDFDSADPLEIHQLWLKGVDAMEPAGDLATLESDTLRQVSRDYTMSDANGTLNATLVTIVNGGRVLNVMAGTTSAGQADYAAVVSAILDTIEVQYADPDTPHDSNEVLVTAVPAMTPDLSDPASVLQAVFDAAASGDFGPLSGLCDPMGENDGDTAAICEITSAHPDKDSFVEFFALGRINGQVSINGDRAELPFLFGPNGDQEETMTLILRDGQWYLFDF
jgi:Tfp pilus assembly protein PilF